MLVSDMGIITLNNKILMNKNQIVTYNPQLPLKDMTVNSTFFLGKYQVENEIPWPIEWEIVHQESDYQIAMTRQIIDCRCFNAKEPTNPNSDRSKYGNNNWQYSNIEQFLNSDQYYYIANYYYHI